MKIPPLRLLLSGIPVLCLSALLFSCAAPVPPGASAPFKAPLTAVELTTLRTEFLESIKSQPETHYLKFTPFVDREEKWYGKEIVQMVPRQNKPGLVDCRIRFHVVDNHGQERQELAWRTLGLER